MAVAFLLFDVRNSEPCSDAFFQINLCRLKVAESLVKNRLYSCLFRSSVRMEDCLYLVILLVVESKNLSFPVDDQTEGY